MKKTKIILLTLIFAIQALCLTAFAASDFPTKPIQFVVPYQAGDASDLSARVVAEQVSKILSQPMVVVNKVGGGGAIGAAEVASAKTDGYTLLQGSHGLITAKPFMDKLPYDHTSFKPVAQIIAIPIAIAVRNESSFKTLADLVSYAKQNPGKIKYSVPGKGTDKHVTIEDLATKAGIQLTVVPYQGGTPALTALFSKDVEVCVVGASVLTGQYKSGDVRIIAITSKNRVDYMPDVPTLREQGYDLDAATWFGALAPKGTPDQIIQTLEGAIKKALSDPQVQAKMDQMNLSPSFLGSKEFEQVVQADAERNKRILKAIGMAN